MRDRALTRCHAPAPDQPGDRIIWRRTGPPLPSYDETLRRLSAAERAIRGVQAERALQVLARIEAEDELADFKARLCLFMAAEPQPKLKKAKKMRIAA